MHKTIHLQKEWFCITCGKKYGNVYSLEFHTRSHNEVMTIECEICKKQINKHRIKPHMRMHSGDKPFKCNSCDKAYPSSGALLTHKKRIMFMLVQSKF